MGLSLKARAVLLGITVPLAIWLSCAKQKLPSDVPPRKQSSNDSYERQADKRTGAPTYSVEKLTKVDSRNHFVELMEAMGLTGSGIEVGAYKGEFADILLKSWIARENVSPYFLLEPFPTPELKARYKLWRADPKTRDHVKLYTATSRIAANNLPGNMYSFVYVDARDHNNLADWWPKLHVNGVFAGHDFCISRDEQVTLKHEFPWEVPWCGNFFTAEGGVDEKASMIGVVRSVLGFLREMNLDVTQLRWTKEEGQHWATHGVRQSNPSWYFVKPGVPEDIPGVYQMAAAPAVKGGVNSGASSVVGTGTLKKSGGVSPQPKGEQAVVGGFGMKKSILEGTRQPATPIVGHSLLNGEIRRLGSMEPKPKGWGAAPKTSTELRDATAGGGGEKPKRGRKMTLADKRRKTTAENAMAAKIAWHDGHLEIIDTPEEEEKGIPAPGKKLKLPQRLQNLSALSELQEQIRLGMVHRKGTSINSDRRQGFQAPLHQETE